MYNNLFTIGPLTVHGYGLMIAIGIICALLCGLKLAKKKGLSTDEVYNIHICVRYFRFSVRKASLLHCRMEIIY